VPGSELITYHGGFTGPNKLPRFALLFSNGNAANHLSSVHNHPGAC
jgi:hypothetical protein